jgi:foldase protein PrsA
MFFTQKRIVTWVAVIALLAVMVAATGCGSKASGVVAEINGEKITRPQLDAFMDIYSLLAPDLDQMLSNESLRPMIEGQLLDAMIENVVVAQAVKELGLTVSEEEKRAAYEEVKLQMLSMLFNSEDEYNQKIQEKKIKEADLISFLGSNVYYEKMEEHFSGLLTDEEIASFIEGHPEMVKTPAILELSHILFDSQEDAQAGYQRLLAGEDFGDLALELSTDGTAQREGHSGYRGYLGNDIEADTKGFDSDFMAGANALENDGDISEPVETQFGWHLIKLHKRTPAGELNPEEARAAAGDALIWEKINSYITTFYAEAKIETMLK